MTVILVGPTYAFILLPYLSFNCFTNSDGFLTPSILNSFPFFIPSTSFDTLKVELNHSCYNKIREIIENISEGLFKHYTVDTYSDLPDLIDDSSSYLEDSDTTYSHFSITSSESESESENDENADIIIKLRKLRILLDEELITNEDYDIVKKRLLEYM